MYQPIHLKILPALIIVCALFGAIAAQAQTNYEPHSFATFAGFPPGSADGTGGGAQFNEPQGVAVDASGNVYVADFANNAIRKIDSTGAVCTLAGSAGTDCNGLMGGTAQFNGPTGVAVDSKGNVYVADTNNYTVRKITIDTTTMPLPTVNVITLAGSGVNGQLDGPGLNAQFASPAAVAVDSKFNVYVADFSAIRKIDSAGNVTTPAGKFGQPGYMDGPGPDAQFFYPMGVAVDATDNNIYVGDWGSYTIRKITTTDGVTYNVSTLAGSAGNPGSADGTGGTGGTARFSLPAGVAVDSSGNVYVADPFNESIRKIDSAGNVCTLAGSASNFGNANGTGGDCTTPGMVGTARFNTPMGVAVDSSGHVYVGDTANNIIRKIDSAGNVTTIAGIAGGSGYNDGTGGTARFSGPFGIAVDTGGNTYVGDTANNAIRKITPAGVVTTLAGPLPGTALAGTAGYNDGPGPNALFNTPVGVAVDTGGNVYVADAGNNNIRKLTINPDGSVTVSTPAGSLAGSAGYQDENDGNGNDALFNGPRGVAVDSMGNVYVVDGNNNSIRKIHTDTTAMPPKMTVSTLAGSLAGTAGSDNGIGTAALFNTPRGVAVDSNFNVYVGDTFNHTVRKIDHSTGYVSTLAGSAGQGGDIDGMGTAARFGQTRGVAVDSAGNVYVGDDGNNTIRKIDSAGNVTTLAGSPNGTPGSADGTGSAALFNFPYGVAVDTSGNVFVADGNNNVIRLGNPAVPPINTQPSSSPVPVNAGQVGVASVSLTFPQVTVAGDTTVTLINPASAGSLPSGFELPGAGYAYDITTTATYCTTDCPPTYPCPNPIIIAFQVPNVDAATFSTLTVLHNEGGMLVNRTIYPGDPNYPANPAPNTIYASVCSLSPFVIAKSKYKAQVQQPINADGSSVFTAKKAVVPVKFTLTQGGTSTCTLPPATIALTRTAGGTTGAVDESVYSGSADTGSNFRISNCQYVYNLSASALGAGTYRVDAKINGQVVGSGFFALK